mmetsp:Transcript_4779/g.7272  ORF Transcript_4779/g.7272 Transcript_4779/m.7272 type:complete len:122 (+) Transcript_4779:962-1327(+)
MVESQMRSIKALTDSVNRLQAQQHQAPSQITPEKGNVTNVDCHPHDVNVDSFYEKFRYEFDKQHIHWMNTLIGIPLFAIIYFHSLGCPCQNLPTPTWKARLRPPSAPRPPSSISATQHKKS